MKRLIIIFSFLLAFATIQGQSLIPGVVSGQGASRSYVEILTTATTPAWWAATSSNLTKDAQDSVSVWADVSGNDNDLLAADNTKKSPVWTTPSTITFNGTTQYMLTNSFTNISQPIFIYMVVNQAAWAEYSTILANGDWSVKFIQYDVTPKVAVSAGTASTRSSDLVVGEWSIVRILFNGASSKFIVDAHSAITGNFGAGTIDQISIGADASGSGLTSIQVKEIIVRNVDDSASADEAILYAYLKAKYGL